MPLRILAVLGLVGLAGSIGWTVWPSDLTYTVPTLPPAEQAVVAATPEPRELQTETVELRRRDTLADLLMRSGLSAADAHALAKGLREAGAILRRMCAAESVVRIAGGHAGTCAASRCPSLPVMDRIA